MKAVIFKIALLLAMLSFPFMGIFSNDTLSTFLISEGDRSLALEKLLQFKCDETWTPLLREYTYDKEGNLYVSVRYGHRLELPSGEVKTNPNMYANALIKFSPEYEILWYKEVNINTKEREGDELNIVCDELIFDIGENKLFVYVHADKMDSLSMDTIIYENNIVAILDTSKTLQDQKHYLISIDTKSGNYLNSIQLPYYSRLSGIKYFGNGGEGIYYRGEIHNKFKGEVYDIGIDKWYFSKMSVDLELIWEFSIGGARVEYLYRGFGLNEPDPKMYIIGDTMYLTYPFQSDSIQINPDKSNPIYLYSSCYEFGISGMGIHNQDAVIEKLCIADDTIRLLAYRKVGWDGVPQVIRQGKDGQAEALFYNDEERRYDTLTCYRINPDLSMERIEEPYQGVNSEYMHKLDQAEKSYFEYDEEFNYIERNLLIGNKDFHFSFSDKAKDILYKNNQNGDQYVKYNNNGEFCYTYIMPILQPIDIKNDLYTGRLFVSGAGCWDYNVAKKYLNWNPWESNQVESNIDKDGGLKSCFLASYVETYKVKGEAYGAGEVIVPDTFIWFGRDCEVQVIPDKGYAVDSVVTDRGEVLQEVEAGRYVVPSVKDVVTVRAYFSGSSAVEDNWASEVRITPNPFTDYIEIASERAVSYEILDVKSVVVKSGAERRIDVSQLPEGVYLLRVYDGKELIKIEKLIKE